MKRRETMTSRKSRAGGWGLGISLLVAASLLLGGCASMQQREKPRDVVATDRGTLIFKEKYEFKRPPTGYSMLKNEEGGDFEIGFFKIEKGDFPSQTTFIYDDLPFGSSRNLEERAKQYCTRFLFNTGMLPEVKNREKTEVVGLPAMAIYLEGENPNQGEKAKSKVYLVQKGNRIVSFLCTQWRPLKGTYDPAGFNDFEEFVKSFKFLKPSFYESFEDRLKQAGF
jgi:hypothetical protein